MRCESRSGSGEQPTTAHTRVPVRMARTSSTCGSSGDARVGSPCRGARRGARARARCRRSGRPSGGSSRASKSATMARDAPRVRLSVAAGERGHGVRRRGRRPPSRRACRRRRGGGPVVAVGRARRARSAHQRGRRVGSVGELLPDVRRRVLAGQDRRLRVADEAAEAARRRGLPRGAVARRRRGAARSRASSPAPAARAAPRRRRRSPRAWRPRAAPSRQQCSQSQGVPDGEPLPVVVEVDVALACRAPATRCASSRSSVSL